MGILTPVLGSLLTGIIEKIFPDKAKQELAKLEMTKALAEIDFKRLELDSKEVQAQIAVNIEQAKSTDPFVSRPRAAAEWMCISVLGAAWGLQILTSIVVFFGYPAANVFSINPELINTSAYLLGSLLGIRAIPSVVDFFVPKKK